jgi:hypothetical protein
MNEPVGINCASELLRIHASTSSAIEALVSELDLTRDEAQAALRAAQGRMSQGSCRDPHWCALHCPLRTLMGASSARR